MWLALVLCAVVASIVPTSEASLSHRALRKAHSSNAADVVHRTGLLSQSKAPTSENIDAMQRDSTKLGKFGPGNCIATWRNEDGHCQIETKCQEHDISKYTVKFICIDAGGEKVRHVFAGGSFDPEEQFDTLIECNKCLAEKQETIEVIADTPAHSQKKERESEELGGSPLAELRSEVKDLEAFMMNTSAELQKLNKKVYSEDFKPKAAAPKQEADKVPEKKKAAKEAKPASFVHHEVSNQEDGSTDALEAPVLHVEAAAARVNKEHRRRREEDNEDPPRKVLKMVGKKADAVPSSLAGAMKRAEERDHDVPAQQPERSKMAVLPEEANAQKKPLMVSFQKADDGEDADGGDDGDEDIPQSGDELERPEENGNEQPSMSELQTDDEDSNADTEAESEDASE